MELFAVSEWELIVRLTVATFLGLLVGAERSRVGKRAGMRTYALVSLGSAFFVIISGVVASKYADTFSFDPSRVLSQIVVGIGFIGAGMIFKHSSAVVGLTTAAGIWVTAAIGAASGFGLHMIAAFVTFMTLFIFEFLWYIEDRFVKVAKFDGDDENQHDDRNQ